MAPWFGETLPTETGISKGRWLRNMFGAGEYHLPMWGKYFEILKQTKAAFDPANLMHPDVLPLPDDYV